ncbi:MAG: murein biosynthesis integral membrane protein MurJ [Bdellovibrionaceae bacterium]|nr:murein biosynthesis integral membrane protein MurJ [Pseudobdellovibrionaceae bacterium]
MGKISAPEDMIETPPENKNNNKNQVVKNAFAMSMGTFSSRILGLLRDTLLMSFFPRPITDAWTAAFRLPNILRRLLGEGSLSVSFIPVFVDCLESSKHGASPAKAQNFLNSLYTLLLIILTGLTALGVLYSDQVMRWVLDESYIQNVENFSIAVRMSQIMFGFIFLMSQYALFMGVLNSLGSFAWPAMAPLFFNISMIISTVLPDAWFSFPGEGLAWGVLIGGIFQMGVLIPPLVRRGYLPKLTMRLWTPEVKMVLSRMVPGLFGMGVLQLSLVINQRFASSLGDGPISYIYIADRLLELPLSLVSVSLGTALLPSLATLLAEGKRKEMLQTAEYYFRLNLYVVLAAATGLYFLGGAIVELFFQRGQFTASDTASTAQVIQIWALIMIPASAVRILAPSYYAVKNTWYPAVISLISLIGHFFLAPVLMEKWGLRGLNYSSLASSSFNFLALFLAFPVFIGSFSVGKFIVPLIKYVFICALMGLVLQIHPLLKPVLVDHWHFAGQAVTLFFCIGLAGVIFILASRGLQLEEYEGTFAKVIRKITRKLGFK